MRSDCPAVPCYGSSRRLLQLIGVRLGQPHVLTLDDPLPEKLLVRGNERERENGLCSDADPSAPGE